MQSYPIGWFTRSNFGGRFSSTLKYAGWGGIVIEGKADKPVWIDLRNKKVLIRAAKKWGRLDEDLASGLLPFLFWGIPVHKEPISQLEWGYRSILGDRDINEHDFDWIKVDANIAKMYGVKPQATAEELVRIYTEQDGTLSR